MEFSQEDSDFLKELYDKYYGNYKKWDDEPKLRKNNRKKKKGTAKIRHVRDQE